VNVPAKLGAFTVAAAVIFAAAFGVGKIVGPVAEAAPEQHEAMAEPELPGGLLVTDRGYTLETVDTSAGTIAFRIQGPDGQPVNRFDTVHDKPMHLIVVRRDLTGLRHVHPTLAADGTWRISVDPLDPGVWRAYADFTPTGGPALKLGTDIAVPGDFQPRPLPEAEHTATVDGYTVSIDGRLEAGRASTVRFTVRLAGRTVTDLEPYLGATGHLVALRQHDLAYLHVHPESGAYTVEVPAAGTYRLFLDFKHAGTVRTAAFTLNAGGHA
jgi:hypothetical protein